MAIEGIEDSYIANKIIDVEIAAYKKIKLKLKLPDFDIKNITPILKNTKRLSTIH